MSKKKSAPSKPSASIQIGDRTVANSYWDGNNYITKYNPTDSETSSMNILQSAIPQAYLDAIDKDGLASYRQNWINNQTNQLNELANKNLTTLKDNLITGGQVGSSTGWNKINAFTDSYTDALNDISSNADTQALAHQLDLLNYANSLQGSMNNYYNLASSLSQTAAQNQNSAWNQNLQQWNAQEMANANSFNPLYSLGQLAATGIGTYLGGPVGGYAANKLYGTTAGSLANKTGG